MQSSALSCSYNTGKHHQVLYSCVFWASIYNKRGNTTATSGLGILREDANI